MVFQSTLPQGEWRLCAKYKVLPTLISIHTPTRGVTFGESPESGRSPISIHTPTRGVTTAALTSACVAQDFNPHSHKGSDVVFPLICKVTLDFNPHSHKGSDLFCKTKRFRHIVFQSTLPQGEWLQDVYYKKRIYFISIHTPTRGVTGSQFYYLRRYRISIHTPTRGVTREKRTRLGVTKFQSTLPQGEWHIHE